MGAKAYGDTFLIGTAADAGFAPLAGAPAAASFGVAAFVTLGETFVEAGLVVDVDGVATVAAAVALEAAA